MSVNITGGNVRIGNYSGQNNINDTHREFKLTDKAVAEIYQNAVNRVGQQLPPAQRAAEIQRVMPEVAKDYIISHRNDYKAFWDGWAKVFGGKDQVNAAYQDLANQASAQVITRKFAEISSGSFTSAEFLTARERFFAKPNPVMWSETQAEAPYTNAYLHAFATLNTTRAEASKLVEYPASVTQAENLAIEIYESNVAAARTSQYKQGRDISAEYEKDIGIQNPLGLREVTDQKTLNALKLAFAQNINNPEKLKAIETAWRSCPNDSDLGGVVMRDFVTIQQPAAPAPAAAAAANPKPTAPSLYESIQNNYTQSQAQVEKALNDSLYTLFETPNKDQKAKIATLVKKASSAENVQKLSHSDFSGLTKEIDELAGSAWTIGTGGIQEALSATVAEQKKLFNTTIAYANGLALLDKYEKLYSKLSPEGKSKIDGFVNGVSSQLAAANAKVEPDLYSATQISEIVGSVRCLAITAETNPTDVATKQKLERYVEALNEDIKKKAGEENRTKPEQRTPDATGKLPAGPFADILQIIQLINALAKAFTGNDSTQVEAAAALSGDTAPAAGATPTSPAAATSPTTTSADTNISIAENIQLKLTISALQNGTENNGALPTDSVQLTKLATTLGATIDLAGVNFSDPATQAKVQEIGSQLAAAAAPNADGQVVLTAAEKTELLAAVNNLPKINAGSSVSP